MQTNEGCDKAVPKEKDLTGRRFGSLVVLRKAATPYISPSGKLEQSIAEHIQNVTNFPDLDKEGKEGSEPYLPLPLQGDWQRGYFAGLAEEI